MEIPDDIKKAIIEMEINASVCVVPQYFEEGDYTRWQDQDEKTKDVSYDEYVKHLINEMSQYECIRLHSDGCLYGIEGGTSHDISYEEFDNPKIFVELAEKYGIEGTLEVYP